MEAQGSESVDRGQAEQDLKFMTDVMRRTHARVDPQMFHFVHWGLIVLIWYPVGNWLQNQERLKELAIVSMAAVLLGTILSSVRGIRESRKPRLPAKNTMVTRQLGLIIAANIIGGMVLTVLAPQFSFIEGPNIPIVWGVVYANLAFMSGVIYRNELLWAGALIFVGVVLAILFSSYNGYILGPFMGLGMIVPGLRGEARVKKLISESTLGPDSV